MCPSPWPAPPAVRLVHIALHGHRGVVRLDRGACIAGSVRGLHRPRPSATTPSSSTGHGASWFSSWCRRRGCSSSSHVMLEEPVVATTVAPVTTAAHLVPVVRDGPRGVAGIEHEACVPNSSTLAASPASPRRPPRPRRPRRATSRRGLGDVDHGVPVRRRPGVRLVPIVPRRPTGRRGRRAGAAVARHGGQKAEDGLGTAGRGPDGPWDGGEALATA